jgi:hypothetical protein
MDFDVPYQAKLHPGCQSTGLLGHPNEDYSRQHSNLEASPARRYWPLGICLIGSTGFLVR